MAPIRKNNSIEHFTHPGHTLVESKSHTGFFCGGCKTPGTSTRFRCQTCDFNLHEYCFKCPRSQSSHLHPHPLALVVRKPQGACQNDRTCDLCGDRVEGLFYRCKGCEFDVHPLCTQLPQYLRHVLHQGHDLFLQPAPVVPSRCAVCGRACGYWRYRCNICCFDIHLECVLVPCDTTRPSYNPPPQQPRPYGGYGPSSSFNPYMTTRMHENGHYGGGYGSGGAAVNGGGGRGGLNMNEIVGKLAVGVLSNVIFGMANLDF